MPLLQATHVNSPAPSHYASLYAGYLESMYAGFGAEWLYRPWRSPLAVGVDLNHVYQRDFDQRLSLRNYHINTGHATAYWDTGLMGLLVKLQVGQYLAGDRGATLDVSRRFSNGVTLGAYATRTNVSAQQFGEGSFDKGIYLNLPFDVMLPKFSDSTATLGWQPLTRDGGARLARRHQLYEVTAGRDQRALEWVAPREKAHTATSPVIANTEELKAFSPPPPLSLEAAGEDASGASRVIQSTLQSAAHTGQQLTHADTQTPWLWGAGLVVGAALMDTRADRWALHRAPAGAAVKWGNAVPLLLGLGALTDLQGDGVGWTALKSVAFALGANQVLRAGVGRARPNQELGSQHFEPFSAQGLKSGFASNHTAAAFALATPFAQTYDMPWLYGAAGLTAIGRVQSRQHWLSDTVAGGVLGYAIGSVLTDEHRQNGQTNPTNPTNPQWWVGPNSIATRWSWK
jgi:membrane-associated phospholipid phosphatase